MKNMKKAQAGKTVKVKKVNRTGSDLGGEIGRAPFPKGRKGMPYQPPTMGGAKNGKKMKSGGAVNYSSAASSIGLTGEGTYSPKPKNVGKRKKMTIQGDLKFKGGGNMGKCKGGC